MGWGWGAVALQAALCAWAVSRVAFTDIDFTAYKQEVHPPWHGVTFDYALLRGDTGPLVYPAGFVWLYGALLHALGPAPEPWQWLFAAGQCASVALWVLVARAQGVTHALPLLALAASRRVTSLWALRLFNDGPTQLLQWAALLVAARGRLSAATVLLALAVSVKMSALLLLPALAVQLLLVVGWGGALRHAALFVALQAAVAYPFLRAAPRAYLAGAFELTRQFEQRWSVNWQFLPEAVFRDRRLHMALLAAHALLLLAFAHWRWVRGGLWRGLLRPGAARVPLSPRQLLRAALECQLVGVLFARSLHYQFYAWYAGCGCSCCGAHVCRRYQPAAVVALWLGVGPHWGWARHTRALLLLLLLEAVYNVYPPRAALSALLHVVHVALVAGLWWAPRDGTVKNS